jgi:hypothetical protein
MPAMSVTTLVLRNYLDGDFDKSGEVDGADLVLWQANSGMAEGATFGQGDNDRDGDVDGADLLAWQQNLGAGAGPLPAASVPEPTALATAVFGVLTPLLLRSNREWRGNGQRRAKKLDSQLFCSYNERWNS